MRADCCVNGRNDEGVGSEGSSAAGEVRGSAAELDSVCASSLGQGIDMLGGSRAGSGIADFGGSSQGTSVFAAPGTEGSWDL